MPAGDFLCKAPSSRLLGKADLSHSDRPWRVCSNSKRPRPAILYSFDTSRPGLRTNSGFEQPGGDCGKLSGLAACGYGSPTLTMSDLTALIIR